MARAGSLTTAAARLGLPKSTVSRRLGRLEQQIGARLVTRTTRGVLLTSEGEALLSRAGPAIDVLDETARRVVDEAGAAHGVVRITAPNDFAVALLPRALVELGELHPRLQVEIEMTNRMLDLAAEGFDLAIRAGLLPDSDLVATRPVTVELWLAASPSYLDARGRPTRVEQLSDHDCTLFGASGFGATWALRRRGRRERRVHVGGRRLTGDMTLVAHTLEAGGGVGLLPSFLVRRAMDRATLERVLPPWYVPGGYVHLVAPAGRHLPHRVRVVRDFLHERFAAWTS